MKKKYQIIYADPPWNYNDKMSGHSFSLIELFARQKTEGWDVWGDEVESDIKLETYNQPFQRTSR